MILRLLARINWLIYFVAMIISITYVSPVTQNFNQYDEVHKEFQKMMDEYALEFYRITNNQKALRTKFELITTGLDGIAGLCSMLTNQIYINVDAIIRSKYPEYSIRQLVFHELTHCVLSAYNHDDKQIIFNGVICPNSIMNSFRFSDSQILYCYIPLKHLYDSAMKRGIGIDIFIKQCYSKDKKKEDTCLKLVN